jgi:hypothetical protein
MDFDLATKVVIPATDPTDVSRKAGLPSLALALTGMGHAAHALNVVAEAADLLLNRKIQVPSVCNMCGLNAGTQQRNVTGPLIVGRGDVKEMTLRVPLCHACAHLPASPGLYLSSYDKVGERWNVTLLVANPTVAGLYAKLNHGSISAPTVPTAPSTGLPDTSLVTVAWPGTRMSPNYDTVVTLDGRPVGAGSFRRGFEVHCRACGGAHVVGLFGVPVSGFHPRRLPSHLFTATPGRNYWINLTYDWLWGGVAMTGRERSGDQRSDAVAVQRQLAQPGEDGRWPPSEQQVTADSGPGVSAGAASPAALALSVASRPAAISRTDQARSWRFASIDRPARRVDAVLLVIGVLVILAGAISGGADATTAAYTRGQAIIGVGFTAIALACLGYLWTSPRPIKAARVLFSAVLLMFLVGVAGSLLSH